MMMQFIMQSLLHVYLRTTIVDIVFCGENKTEDRE